jgi:hypothetical protein
MGFQFTEVMAGTFRRTDGGDGGEHPIKFTGTARAKSLFRHLADRKADLEGHIDAEGLATHQPLHGHIVLDPLIGKVIRYDFTFPGDAGKTYRFAGQKDVAFSSPVGSMTTLPGEITDQGTGAQIATCDLRFDMNKFHKLLGSFRPTF